MNASSLIAALTEQQIEQGMATLGGLLRRRLGHCGLVATIAREFAAKWLYPSGGGPLIMRAPIAHTPATGIRTQKYVPGIRLLPDARRPARA